MFQVKSKIAHEWLEIPSLQRNKSTPKELACNPQVSVFSTSNKPINQEKETAVRNDKINVLEDTDFCDCRILPSITERTNCFSSTFREIVMKRIMKLLMFTAGLLIDPSNNSNSSRMVQNNLTYTFFYLRVEINQYNKNWSTGENF